MSHCLINDLVKIAKLDRKTATAICDEAHSHLSHLKIAGLPLTEIIGLFGGAAAAQVGYKDNGQNQKPRIKSASERIAKETKEYYSNSGNKVRNANVESNDAPYWVVASNIDTSHLQNTNATNIKSARVEDQPWYSSYVTMRERASQSEKEKSK